jgi:putative ABC transport system permease protein
MRAPVSRLRPIDLARTGTVGLRARPVRTMLTAIGISIGIAALVAVVGISASSKADLLAELDRLGTNLLQVRAGQTMFGDDSQLPDSATSMVRRIGPVENAASTATVSGATVRRTDLIDEAETGGIAVVAADLELLDTVTGELAAGRWLDSATDDAPAVVLGATAAERLGITSLAGSPMVWIGDRWWAVVGILEPVPLLSSLDANAVMGFPAAERYFDHDGTISTLYVRADQDQVNAVRNVLAATANPAAPSEVEISRPSDALEAKAAVDTRLRTMLLALGSVALLVGGIGIANVMVISVLERRSEIGVRRAVGATRRHVRLAFGVEAIVLAAFGGAGGAALGGLVTAIYSRREGVPLELPLEAVAGGVGAAVLVGAIAGAIPAARAARLAPADALRPA